MRVLNASGRSRFVTLGALFFIQWMAYAAWMVPLTLVLRAHELSVIQSYAFATSALAAFVSPLIFEIDVIAIPEPATVVGLLVGGLAVSLAARRRR